MTEKKSTELIDLVNLEKRLSEVENRVEKAVVPVVNDHQGEIDDLKHDSKSQQEELDDHQKRITSLEDAYKKQTTLMGRILDTLVEIRDAIAKQAAKV